MKQWSVMGALIALLLLFAMPVSAFVTGTPVPTDSRIKTYVYNANDVFRIMTYYGYQMNIEFGGEEEIETVSVGDRTGWQITPGTNRLFIRAMNDEAHTNMTVITNERTYQFDLYSSPPGQEGWDELVYVVRFYYPGDKENQVASYQPQKPMAPMPAAFPAPPMMPQMPPMAMMAPPMQPSHQMMMPAPQMMMQPPQLRQAPQMPAMPPMAMMPPPPPPMPAPSFSQLPPMPMQMPQQAAPIPAIPPMISLAPPPAPMLAPPSMPQFSAPAFPAPQQHAALPPMGQPLYSPGLPPVSQPPFKPLPFASAGPNRSPFASPPSLFSPALPPFQAPKITPPTMRNRPAIPVPPVNVTRKPFGMIAPPHMAVSPPPQLPHPRAPFVANHMEGQAQKMARKYPKGSYKNPLLAPRMLPSLERVINPQVKDPYGASHLNVAPLALPLPSSAPGDYMQF